MLKVKSQGHMIKATIRRGQGSKVKSKGQSLEIKSCIALLRYDINFLLSFSYTHPHYLHGLGTIQI